jgi:hypothetical protein
MSVYKKQVITQVAQQLHSYGFTVYLAKGGEHGFYTDGTRVVSFGGQWEFSVDFGGNYRALTHDGGRRIGTGWQIAKELSGISEDQARAFITAGAPMWAVHGEKFAYTTPAEHLQTYGKSSGYEVFNPVMKTYRASLHGRKKGAIGITYAIETTVTALNEAMALLALYDDYEHIRHATFTEVPPQA